jgi:hypothetical protein
MSSIPRAIRKAPANGLKATLTTQALLGKIVQRQLVEARASKTVWLSKAIEASYSPSIQPFYIGF